MERCNWWRLNKKEEAISDIEWTPDKGGVVRARLDSLEAWEYRPCEKARFAVGIGEGIIRNQKERREQK
jgi:hypothetical protein